MSRVSVASVVPSGRSGANGSVFAFATLCAAMSSEREAPCMPARAETVLGGATFMRT